MVSFRGLSVICRFVLRHNVRGNSRWGMADEVLSILTCGLVNFY